MSFDQTRGPSTRPERGRGADGANAAGIDEDPRGNGDPSPLPPFEHFANEQIGFSLEPGGDELLKTGRWGGGWVTAPPRPEQVFATLPPQPMFLMGMAASGVYLVAGALSRIVNLPKAGVWLEVTFLIVATVLVAGGLVYVRRGRAPKAPAEFEARLSKESDLSKRVRVVGSARFLYAARPRELEEFEPVVYAVPFALPDRRKAAIFAYAGLCVVFMGLVVMMQRIGVLPKNSGPWPFWAAMGAASMPLAWAWPTYLRVVPGRIDVMRYSFLGTGKPKVTKLDLRESEVAFGASGGVLVVRERGGPSCTEGAGEADTPRRAWIVPVGGWIFRKAHLARAIVEAAVSRAPTPPLPEDELTG